MSNLLTPAPALTPEVRLAQAISEFALILPTKERVVFRSLQRSSEPSPADIIRLTEEINRDGARMHRGWQHQATRLVAILDRVQMFAKVGDVLIGGSQSMVACGVWAVVKLALQVATGYLSFFDKVSTFFLHITKTSAIQKDLALLFPDCKELQHLMCEYLIVLVQTCAQIIQFTKKGSLSLFSASLFVSFDKEFKSYEDGLERWARQINQRVVVLSTKSNTQNQSLLLRASAQSTRSLDEQRMFRLLRFLSRHQADFSFLWRKERKKGGVRWIFRDDTFQAWKSSKVSSVAWITGSIGSGKTVLMANIVGDLHATDSSENTPLVASFFCHHSNQHSLKARNIVGSIAYQLIQPLLVAENTMPMLQPEQLERLSTGDTGAVTTFLADVLPKTRHYFVVVDALDECGAEEIEEVAIALSQLAESIVVRICFSSRRDSTATNIASQHLAIEHRITMANEDRMKEMAEYIDAEIARRNISNIIDPDLQGLVRDTLTAKADGMYLWVALQIESIFPRYRTQIISDLDVFKMLDTLPRDLPEAFNRALERISDDRYGRTIFKLIAAAKRPITAEELRIALNVEPGIPEWSPATLAYDGELLVGLCGGGLLEIEEENDTVGFIHFSSLQHLLQRVSDSDPLSKFHFTLEEADLQLGSICVTYLSYSNFQMQLTVNRAAMVDVGVITDKVAASLFSQNTMTGRFLSSAFRNLSLGQTSYPQQVNIAASAQDFLVKRQKKDDVRGFLAFAKRHWLNHTTLLFRVANSPSYRLFKKILGGDYPHVSKPWAEPIHVNGLNWAIKHSHGSLFRYLLDDDKHRREVLATVASLVSTRPSEFKLGGDHLGDIIGHLVSHGYLDAKMFRVFVEKGAPLAPSLPTQKSILASAILAMRDGKLDMEIVSLFLEAKADPLEALPAAIELGWKECAERLLQAAGPLSDEKLRHLLVFSAQKGSTEIAQLLLQQGADPNAQLESGETLVQFAARIKNAKLVLHLAEHGGLLDVPGAQIPPLVHLIRTGNSIIASRILSSLRVPLSTATLNTALHAAVGLRDSLAQPLAVQLLDAGAEVDCLLEGEYTPLAKVVMKGHPEILTTLLERGASLNVRFGQNLSPALSLACKMRHLEVVNRLLESGANPNETCMEGLTALHHALEFGDTYLVNLLLDAGADPNVSSSNGTWPIGQVIDRCDWGLLNRLLEHGARLDIEPIESDAHPLRRACAILAESFPYSRGGSPHRVVIRLLEGYTSVRGMEPIYQIGEQKFDGAEILLFVDKGLDLNAPCFLQAPETHPVMAALRLNLSVLMTNIVPRTPRVVLNTALWSVALKPAGKRDYAALLLEHGADPSAERPKWASDGENTLLLSALSSGQEDLSLQLLNSGAAIDIGSGSVSVNPVLAAARFGKSQAFMTIWVMHVAGTMYEGVLEEEVRSRVAEVWEPLTRAQRLTDPAGNDGHQTILAFLDSIIAAKRGQAYELE